MKKILAVLIFGIGMTFAAAPTFAASVWLPFGGKIVSIFPTGLCGDAKPPFIIQPSGIMSPGPYGGTPYALANFPQEVIAPGVWVIGLYAPTPIPFFCPPLPTPVLPVIIIGTSKIPSL